MNSAPELAQASLGAALGRIASGVYVVTYEDNSEHQGILATWIAQASFKPPMITLAFNKERPILQHLKAGSKMTVNVLSKQNMDIFKHFAKPHVSGEERFAGLAVESTDAWGVVFKNVIAYLTAEAVSINDAGDHVVVIAEVKNGNTINAQDEPMVHLRKNGFQY